MGHSIACEEIEVTQKPYSYVLEMIDDYLPPSEEEIKELYNRSLLVESMQVHKRYVTSITVVVGVGAVTTHTVEGFVRKSIPVIVVDGDTVSIHNLERTAIFTREDVGYPKVEAVRRFAQRVNPRCLVIPVYANFQDFAFHPHIEKELPKHVKLVVSGLDNGEALYHTWLFSIRNNIPHVDGATFERSTHCYVFPNPRKGPCYLCCIPKSFYENISASYSCTRNTEVGGIGPSYALTSKLAGDLVFTEACKLLHGDIPDYNEIRMVVSNWHFEREGILPSKTHKYGHVTLWGA